MSTIAFDLEQLYRRTFGGRPYKVAGLSTESAEQRLIINEVNNKVTHTPLGSTLREMISEDKEIWLPTRFLKDDLSLHLSLPYSVVKISGKKTIVKTPMAERQGTVKELYSTDDYSISIKGFIIDENRVWPEDEVNKLKSLFELQTAVLLDNALTNIFLGRLEGAQKVVIESLELPEVEGGRKHVRPFNMQLESDSIFTLEV
jgi:uncharacterized protein DUF6046